MILHRVLLAALLLAATAALVQCEQQQSSEHIILQAFTPVANYRPKFRVKPTNLPADVIQPLGPALKKLNTSDKKAVTAYLRYCAESPTLKLCSEFKKKNPDVAKVLDDASDYDVDDDDSTLAEQGDAFEGDILLDHSQQEPSFLELDMQQTSHTSQGTTFELRLVPDDEDSEDPDSIDQDSENDSEHPEGPDEAEHEPVEDGEVPEDETVERPASEIEDDAEEPDDGPPPPQAEAENSEAASLLEMGTQGEKPGATWPDAVVHYKFHSSITAVSRSNLERAIRHWEANTCIDFKEKSGWFGHFLKMRDSNVCSSNVGRARLAIFGQWLNLAAGCGYGAAVHELGHAIGFYHEQSRQDRDKFVKIYWDRIQSSKKHNFKKYWAPAGQDSLPYDFSSIMHYGKNSFQKSGVSLPTIVPKNPDGTVSNTISIGQRSGLSSFDILQAQLLYNCKKCKYNSQCPSAHSYCNGRFCKAKRQTGETCTKGKQCYSGKCSWFRCAECTKDSHCGSGRYCANKNLPFVKKYCKNRKSNGSWCTRGSQCASGKCKWFKCRECSSNSHCSSGKVCRNYKCQSKLANGKFCGTSNSKCQSGICKLLFCRECSSNSHCGSGKACINYKCKSKLANGKYCGTSNSKCQSGICKLLFCRECSSNSHCHGGKTCLNYKCKNKLSNGSWCTQSGDCASGICKLLKCRQCTSNSHCGSGKYCSLYSCRSKKGKGAWCAKDSACASNNCKWFKCR